MKENEIVNYVKLHFPNTPTEKIAKDLGLTSSKVRTIAKNNNVTKTASYLQELKTNLVKNRRKWYEERLTTLSPTEFQEQIILGSLLGDGYISNGAKRSINCSYQEHFGEVQREYREWKLNKLESLNFTINGNYLRSQSHPYFTHLRKALYHKSQKILTSSFLSKCTHPIFLTVLYLDDGSLTLSYHYNNNTNTVYCHPCITISTLNFSEEENKLLATHLNNRFGTQFVTSKHPHGKGTIIKLNKEKDVRNFLTIIQPFTKDINTLLYKTGLTEKMNSKQSEIRTKYGENVNIVLSSSNRNKVYSKKEIALIIQLYQSGYTYQMIADYIGRSYWSVVYKIRELKKKRLI